MRQHARFPRLALMACLVLAACGDDSNDPPTPQPTPLTLAVELVANVDVPVKLTAPAGDPRLFVATKGGTVRIIQDGTLLPTPFLDISSIVHQNSEQGFLGLAFDPAYATNGRFFVSYTSSANENVVASYTVSTADPIWRMPLWQPYDTKLSSKVADVNNVTSDGFAGSITAALFLQRFVERARAWAHFDIFAWCPVERPHCPVGGEAQAIRAIEAVLAKRHPAA